MFGAQRRMNPKHCPTQRGHSAERASLDFKGTYLYYIDLVPKTKSPGGVGHRRLWHGGSGWNLNRLALPSRRASSDSALILKLKLQVSDQLGQTLSRERIAGL
jgi:hypothetical protein